MKSQNKSGNGYSEEVQAAVTRFRCMPSEEVRVRSIQIFVLISLAAQNCALTMLTSYSRSVSGPKYLASTAVVAGELLKTFVVMCQLFCKHGIRQVFLVVLPHNILTFRTMKYAIPAIFYTVQNNLWFYANDHLDPVTVAVTSQLKVLTTAVFSVVMLGRRLSYMHWFALLVLICGLIVMQYKGGGGNSGDGNFYYGLLAMVVACSSSGFAGVYLELLFKQLDTDIWMANMQLQLFCLPVAGLGLFSDLQHMEGRGPLYGWDSITGIVVLLSAMGGFLVSFTMKYANNILKTFAVSMSLVANCLLSSFVLSLALAPHTLGGVSLVIASSWLYSIGGRFLKDDQKPEKDSERPQKRPEQSQLPLSLQGTGRSSPTQKIQVAPEPRDRRMYLIQTTEGDSDAGPRDASSHHGSQFLLPAPATMGRSAPTQ